MTGYQPCQARMRLYKSKVRSACAVVKPGTGGFCVRLLLSVKQGVSFCRSGVKNSNKSGSRTKLACKVKMEFYYRTSETILVQACATEQWVRKVLMRFLNISLTSGLIALLLWLGLGFAALFLVNLSRTSSSVTSTPTSAELGNAGLCALRRELTCNRTKRLDSGKLPSLKAITVGQQPCWPVCCTSTNISQAWQRTTHGVLFTFCDFAHNRNKPLRLRARGNILVLSFLLKLTREFIFTFSVTLALMLGCCIFSCRATDISNCESLSCWRSTFIHNVEFNSGRSRTHSPVTWNRANWFQTTGIWHQNARVIRALKIQCLF